MDLTAATTAVSGVSTDLQTVGVAIIGVAAVALGIRWIKAMFF
jgi:hypothetical protein